MAAAAILNAVWDLCAKREGKPLWQLLARHVARADRRRWSTSATSTDALTPDGGARAAARARSRAARSASARCWPTGCPAYTTSPGWLGYADDKLRRLCGEALDDGFTHVKLKVGADVEDDVRRCAIAREALGAATRLSVDANQAWDVDDRDRGHGAPRAVRHHLDRGAHEPRRRARPRRDRARGRAGRGRHRRARAEPRDLQAAAAGASAIGVCQIDACRLAGRQRGRRGAAAGGQVRRRRSARTPAASACASSSSTWRRSTTSPSAASSRTA